MNPKITHWMKIGPGEARSMVSQQDNFWDKIGQNVNKRKYGRLIIDLEIPRLFHPLQRLPGKVG